MEFNATFLATIISFIVFVLLMNKVLYAPILRIMAERRAFIEANYSSAKDNDLKTESLIQDKEEKLTNAKNEAKEKYNESVNSFKAQRFDIISDAQNSAKENLEQSKINLENISNEVKHGLKSSMTDLANDIVEKVIGYRSEIKDFDDEAVNNILWEK